MVDEVAKTENEGTPEPVVEKPSKVKADAAAGEKPPAVKSEKDTLKAKKLPKVNKVDLFNTKYLKMDIPLFKAGDTLRVHYLIVEGDKTRVQVFEGICIARKHGGLNETIKVRKISGSVGVERTFFLHSRRIEKIEVKKIGQVRRAKIYFLRGRIGKAARIREKSLH
jgi:large subunit ribosomal protein L19